MSELSLSDQLDRMELEDIEEGAKAAIEAMKKSLTSSYEHMIRVGHFLNAMKAKLPHGAWGPWLKENFEDSQQWAHRLMVCAADRANLKSTLNLTTVSTIEQHYSMLMNTPEKQAKRAEREARKAEAPAKPAATPVAASPVAASTIRQESPTAPQTQPEKPAWLADPDELERPEADDLPSLPRTNTHHTTENRRTPDAREMDRANVVTVEESFRHGAWYEWSEPRQRMLPLDDYAICCRAEEISPPPAELATVLARHNADDILRVMLETRDGRRESPKEVLRLLKKMADELQEPGKSPKRFTKPTAAEVAAYATEIGAAIDAEQFVDFYESKDWMIGKNRMKDWRAAVRTWKRGQAAKPGTVENGKVRSANWEDDGTGWEDLRNG